MVVHLGMALGAVVPSFAAWGTDCNLVTVGVRGTKQAGRSFGYLCVEDMFAHDGAVRIGCLTARKGAGMCVCGSFVLRPMQHALNQQSFER